LSLDCWAEIENKVNQIPDQSGKLERIRGLITYYELNEARTIFELAVWKAKIEEENGQGSEPDREACRIAVPGPVQETILQFISYNRDWCSRWGGI